MSKSNVSREGYVEAAQRGMLARCGSTGRIFSVGPVKTVARYSDCTVFVCPCCGCQHDDRPQWGGSSPKGQTRRQGYSDVCVDEARALAAGHQWVRMWPAF